MHSAESLKAVRKSLLDSVSTSDGAVVKRYYLSIKRVDWLYAKVFLTNMIWSETSGMHILDFSFTEDLLIASLTIERQRVEAVEAVFRSLFEESFVVPLTNQAVLLGGDTLRAPSFVAKTIVFSFGQFDGDEGDAYLIAASWGVRMRNLPLPIVSRFDYSETLSVTVSVKDCWVEKVIEYYTSVRPSGRYSIEDEQVLPSGP
jgi:hypothetical protein